MDKLLFIADVKTGTIWSKSSSTARLSSSFTNSFIAAEPNGPQPLLIIINSASAESKDLSRCTKFGCMGFRGACSEEEAETPLVVDVLQRRLKHDEGISDEENSRSIHGAIIGYPGLAVVDQRGYVYVFDLDNARFDLITKIGIAGTAVALGVHRPAEVIVALSDRSIHCYNIDDLKLVAKLSAGSHHKNTIHHISVHPLAPKVLTTSPSESILWDMETWTKLLVLSGGKNQGGVFQTSFSQMGELIVGSFQDNSLLIWDTESLILLWRLDTEAFPEYVGAECFAISRDSTLLATAGRHLIQVWSLVDKTCTRQFDDRALEEGILQIQFVGESTMLVVLNMQGDLLFIDVVTGFIKEMANLEDVRDFSVSADGKVLAVHPVAKNETIVLWSIHELLTYEHTPTVHRSPRESPVPDKSSARRSMSLKSTKTRTASSVSTSTVKRTGSSNQLQKSPRLVATRKSTDPLLEPPASPGKRRSLQTVGPGVPGTPRRQTLAGSIMAMPIEKRLSLTNLNRSQQVASDKPALKSAGILAPTEFRQPISAYPYTGRQLLHDSPRPSTADPVPTSSRVSDHSGGAASSMASGSSFLTAGPLLNNLDLNNMSEADMAMIYRSLEKFIRKRYGFPDEFRLVIWKFLLKIPVNNLAFSALEEKGLHPVVDELRRRFNIANPEIRQAMERTMSALAHWNPAFSELAYLPYLAFPFIKLYYSEVGTCFEMLLSIIVNWCQDWWGTFPGPPTTALGALDDLLLQQDPHLYQHFQDHGVDVLTYGWVPLQSLYSENLNKTDWLRLWDHCFSRQPRFLYYFAVALLITQRSSIFKLNTTEEFRAFFHSQQPADVKLALKLAAKLSTASFGSDNDIYASHLRFRPIPRAVDYPETEPIDIYPSFKAMLRAGTKVRSKPRRGSEASSTARLPEEP